MINKSINTQDAESVSETPKAVITVAQPQKLESLLETINLMNTVSERIGETKSGDLGGGSGAQTQQGGQAQQSKRDDAIAAIPSSAVMQKQLEKHIHSEVKKLHKELKRVSRASKPGAAYNINTLYARIRRLNGMLKELLESSVDIIKRLYVRIFIDKQAVL